MEVAPLLPPIPLPNAFQLPAPTLDVPLVNPPRWVLVPQRLKDYPEPVAPQTESSKKTEEEEKPAERKVDPPLKEKPPKLPQPPPVTFHPLPALPEQKLDTVLNGPTEVTEENSITIPLIEVEIPLPSNEIMITASTTATVAAVASVGGALVAKTVFDNVLQLIKPVLKIVVNKLQKVRGKETTTWARQRLKRRNK